MVFCRLHPTLGTLAGLPGRQANVPWPWLGSREQCPRHVTGKTRQLPGSVGKLSSMSLGSRGTHRNIDGSCNSSRISGRNSHVLFSENRAGANWIIMRRTGALALLSALAHGTLAAADSSPRGVGPECKSLSSVADSPNRCHHPSTNDNKQHARTSARIGLRNLHF